VYGYHERAALERREESWQNEADLHKALQNKRQRGAMGSNNKSSDASLAALANASSSMGSPQRSGPPQTQFQPQLSSQSLVSPSQQYKALDMMMPATNNVMMFPPMDATQHMFLNSMQMDTGSGAEDYLLTRGNSLYGSESLGRYNSLMWGETMKPSSVVVIGGGGGAGGGGGPTDPNSNHMMSPHGVSSLSNSINNGFASIMPEAPSCLLKDEIPLDPRITLTINDSFLLFGVVLRVIVEGQTASGINFGQSIGVKKSPMVVDGLEAITKFEAIHKDFGILALNLFVNRFEDLYLAQNFKSIQYLGVVARNFSNSRYRPLISESNLIGFLRNLLFCVRFVPGEEIVFSCKVLLVTGEALLRLVMTFSNGVLLIGGECR